MIEVLHLTTGDMRASKKFYLEQMILLTHDPVEMSAPTTTFTALT
jgi:hypothetical protein